MNSNKFLMIMTIIIFNVLVFGCFPKENFKIDETILEKSKMDDFILPANNDEIIINYKGKDKTSAIQNVISSGYNTSGDFFVFLSTDNESRQILLVISQKRNIFKWIDFFPKTSHFYREKLIAFVIKPFPERHSEEEIYITDFINNKEITRVNSSIRSIDQDKLQDLYYVEPSFSKDEEGLVLYIYWEQAHYPMTKMSYFLDSLDVGFSSNDGNYSITELEENNSFDINLNGVLENYTILSSQENRSNIIAIVIESDEILTLRKVLEWEDCSIIIASKSNIIKQIPLVEVFKFQDALLSIKSGKPIDHRAAFIIETAEFTYDFYFDPITEESDSFLRPSSFVTRYPH